MKPPEHSGSDTKGRKEGKSKNKCKSRERNQILFRKLSAQNCHQNKSKGWIALLTGALFCVCCLKVPTLDSGTFIMSFIWHRLRSRDPSPKELRYEHRKEKKKICWIFMLFFPSFGFLMKSQRLLPQAPLASYYLSAHQLTCVVHDL